MANIETYNSRPNATSPRSTSQRGRAGTEGVLTEDDAAEPFYRPAAARPRRGEGDFGGDAGASFAERTAEEAGGEDGEPFLRSRRRVPVRNSLLPKNRWARIGLAAGVVAVLAGGVAMAVAVRSFLKHDPRFRIEGSQNIRILGNSQVTRAELLSVFGADIGRNVFFVPLAERRAGLESLPWVEHATVMRVLPNQLRVSIVERTPIADVLTGKEVGLVDVNGVLLQMPAAAREGRNYSFPVVTGINADDPLSTRSARMHLFQRFMGELDSSGEKISQQISEVDLSDPEDVKATTPAGNTEILLHFGDENFLERYRSYQAHLAEWQQQYPHLASVDLRYEQQVVLDVGAQTPPPAAPAAGDAVVAAPPAEPAAKPKPVAKSPAKGGVKTAAKAHPAAAKKAGGAAHAHSQGDVERMAAQMAARRNAAKAQRTPAAQ